MADQTNRVRTETSENADNRLDDFRIDIGKDADLMADQRDKANEDMRFVNVTGGMWEGWLEDDFSERTKMEFDLVSDYLWRFIGEWNLNRIGVDYRPDDSKTSDDDAELLNGIYRADFRDGSGKISLDNAVYEAATCGYGAFKLASQFEDEGDPENEAQRIEWRPIQNAFNTVYWDQSAKRIDKRDARWCTVLTEFTPDSFREAFPDFEPSSAYQPYTRSAWNFMSGGQVDRVYVATRYEVIRKREPVFVYDNLSSGDVEVYNKEDHELIKDELKADTSRKFKRERKVLRQHVEKSIFSGTDFLEEPKRISGKFIPIVPVYGYRSFVDGAEWYHGLVRKLKDAARLFNMQISQLAENSASAGQDVPIFDPDQMPPNVAALWADRNNLPYLLAKALRDDDGNIIAQGPIGYLKPPALDQSTQALMQIVPGFIKELTGGAPTDIADTNASGKAIRALTKRQNLNTQPVQDNIATAIAWSGTIYQSMAAEIYNRQQMVRTVGQDGTDSMEQLLTTVLDEETNTFVESNSLRGKKFRVYSDIGPQYESLREETVENLKGIGDFLREMPEGQQYMPALLGVILENMEGIGLGPLKAMNRKIMIMQGHVKPKTDEEKKMLAQAQEPQEDPQAGLIQAATNQANATAEKESAEARNLDSDSVDNIAAAKKKAAETAKIISETQQGEIKTFAELRKQTLEEAQGLPFN